MASGAVLSTEKLNAGYGRFHILFDIDIDVAEREIFIIVGPNGSGKSTLLKTLFGLTKVYSGKIHYRGKDITKLPAHARAKIGLAYLPQVGNVFAELTVEENLRMAGYTLRKEEVEERTREVLEMFPFLKEKLRAKAKTLSGGQRQLLAMAMSLIRQPELLMFDEPTAGLSPLAAKEVVDKIVWLRRELGKTIILVEQNARLALEIGDRAVLLVSGRIAYKGPARDLLEDEELGSRYLGLKSVGR